MEVGSYSTTGGSKDERFKAAITCLATTDRPGVAHQTRYLFEGQRQRLKRQLAANEVKSEEVLQGFF